MEVPWRHFCNLGSSNSGKIQMLAQRNKYMKDKTDHASKQVVFVWFRLSVRKGVRKSPFHLCSHRWSGGMSLVPSLCTWTQPSEDLGNVTGISLTPSSAAKLWSWFSLPHHSGNFSSLDCLDGSECAPGLRVG